MLKKLISPFIIALIILPVTGHADLLVGINVGKSLSAEMELDGSRSSMLTADTDNTSFSAYIGSKSHKNNRISIGFESISIDLKDYSDKPTATGVRFDVDFVYTEQKVKPYWGIGFGVYSLKDSPVLVGTTGEGDSQKGFSFQAKAGTKIELVKKIEFDLSLQYQTFVWQDVEITTPGGIIPRKETYSLSNDQLTIGAGIAFIF
ncbi:outer membrane beta-barrel protein [Marinospirillum insulare]|uniref:Outer membrane protein beta-barrel domain-containing protein n=1 Tax=Marinospirillum insulare TaxID=217169 RepID=A0ABQ5ZSS9_9GAMM|nr:outer membrane beta-barrel protein [Marinospirillum insulare]GLR63189.1 hypothetical protein GCM10007878_06240 [Marinospirillum insulare]